MSRFYLKDEELEELRKKVEKRLHAEDTTIAFCEKHPWIPRHLARAAAIAVRHEMTREQFLLAAALEYDDCQEKKEGA